MAKKANKAAEHSNKAEREETTEHQSEVDGNSIPEEATGNPELYDDDDDEDAYADYYAAKKRIEEEEPPNTIDNLVRLEILREKTPMEKYGGILEENAKEARGEVDPIMKTPLSKKERARLKFLEKTAHGGDLAFLKGGLALLEIYLKKLYRETHRHFMDYLKDRFEFSRVRAYQLMDASLAYEYLKPCFEEAQLPTKVAPLLELKDLEPEGCSKVYAHALEIAAKKDKKKDQKPTANDIKISRQELGLGKKPPEPEDDPDDSDPEPKRKRSREFKYFQTIFKSLQEAITEISQATFNRLVPQLIMKLNTIELEEAKKMLEELTGQVENSIAKATKLAEKAAKNPHKITDTMLKREAKKWGFLDDSNYTCEVFGLGNPGSKIPSNPRLTVRGKRIVESITEEPDGTIKARRL